MGYMLRCLLLLLWLQGTVAQTGILELHYDFRLDLGVEMRYQARLLIQEGLSLFIWGRPDPAGDSGDPYEFTIQMASDSLSSFTFADRVSDRMLSRLPFIGGKHYLVRETVPRIPWKLTGRTRQIGSYACQEATAAFRGRIFRVWFCPAVAVSAGPWKLSGAPGLIVYAADELGEVSFLLRKLRHVPGVVALPETEGTRIDLDEFVQLQKQFGSNILRRVNAKLPRGSRISLTGQNALERFD